MNKSFILTGLVTLAFASTAFAQSTVSGTLTGGGTGTSSGGSSVTGTVGSGNSLTGTVSSPPASGGGGGTTSTGGGGGGGGGGSGNNTIDICPNIAGVQSTLPSGYVLVNGNCDPASTSTGGGTSNPGIPSTGTGGSGATGGTPVPGVPNTGSGGMLAETLALLSLSAAAAFAGTRQLFRRA